MARHKEFMEYAKHLTYKSDVKTHHHGAIIISSRGEIIAEGWNHYVNQNLSPFTEHNTFHAERHAIFTALWEKKNIKDAIMYVVRVNKRGQFRNSRPCNNCARKILEHGIKTIYYSISDLDCLKMECISMGEIS